MSEGLPENRPMMTWKFSVQTLILKLLIETGCFYGFVHEGTELHKYLPKMLEALLEVTVLPLSHRSLFILWFDNFSFVVYLCYYNI